MKTVAKLFLVFSIVTAIELFLLLKLAEMTNWWVTLAAIVVPGVVGAWLAKREGGRALREVQAALALQREPTGAILDGALVLVAGALLVTPGVLTDLTGLALLVPPVRRAAREYARRRIRRAVDRGLATGSIRMGGLGPFGGGDGPFEVIDAEDVRKGP